MAGKPRAVRKPKEPTRAELYRKARRLGIPGRSNMNKRALKVAVSRRNEKTSTRTPRKSQSRWRRPSHPRAIAAAGAAAATFGAIAVKALRSRS